MISSLTEFAARKRNEEGGYMLVTVLVIMLLLVVLGIAATTTTTIEVQIAGNEKVNKQTFYEADGGTELGAEVLEQNVSCPGGFTANQATGERVINNVVVASDALALWQQVPGAPTSDADRDVFFPVNYGTGPHININIGGNTALSSGNALQMAAGYEGKGKAAAAGGARIVYDIYAQSVGEANSQATILLQWQHVIGQEGSCNYN